MSRSTTSPPVSPPRERAPNAGSSTLPTAQVRKKKGQTNDTSAASSLHKRLTRQLAGIMAHLERNPRDVLSQKRVATINELLRR